MENPIGNTTAAKQNKTIAEKPTHLAAGITRKFQWEIAKSMIVVDTQKHPAKMQMSVSCHSGWRVGEVHVCVRPYIVMHVHISPNRVSPPTSDTIQSGKDKLASAKISAAKNNALEITVNLSIFK